MLTNNEQQQIKSILQSPAWQTVERVANLKCDKIAYDSKLRDTEWDTMKTFLIEEGKVQGIKEFIKELYNQAQQ